MCNHAGRGAWLVTVTMVTEELCAVLAPFMDILFVLANTGALAMFINSSSDCVRFLTNSRKVSLVFVYSLEAVTLQF